MATETLLIVDDDATSREGFANVAEVADYLPLLAKDFLARPADLVSFARKHNVSAVLCDHKLKEARLAGFEGAEGVAALYTAKIPALLVTAYEPADVDISIRPFRRRIPCLMHRRPKPKELRSAIAKIRVETVDGVLALDRRPYRASLFVDSVTNNGGHARVHVAIPQAAVKQIITIMLETIPGDARAEAKPGGWLLAEVNINAECVEDLYVDDVRLPPAAALKEYHAKNNRH